MTSLLITLFLAILQLSIHVTGHATANPRTALSGSYFVTAFRIGKPLFFIYSASFRVFLMRIVIKDTGAMVLLRKKLLCKFQKESCPLSQKLFPDG